MRIPCLTLAAFLALAGCASITPPVASTSIAENYVSPNGTCRIRIPAMGAGFSEFFPPDERFLIVGSMACGNGTCRLIDLNRRWSGNRIAIRLTADGAITGSPVNLDVGNVMLGSPRAEPESCRFIPASPKMTDPTPDRR